RVIIGWHTAQISMKPPTTQERGMQILVFNAGSSSLKFGVFSVATETHEVLRGSYERFRDGECEYRLRQGDADERGTASFDSPGEALKRSEERRVGKEC